jgi:sarcosine oxidase
MHDVIILGTGGVGSAAAFHAARRGLRVLGIDRFPAGHDRGSSHGHTRIIRMAYFEHPDYVPLLRESYRLWDELSALAKQSLFNRCGLLQVGPMSGVVIPGVLESVKLHQLPIEHISDEELDARFPGFTRPQDCEVLLEANAGYLLVEACVIQHIEQARHHGADFVVGESVQSWHATPSCVTVTTDRGSYQARNLIIAGGAWSSGLLQEVHVPLIVRRKHLHWRKTSTNVYRNGPCFFYEMPEGYFYGFPEVDEYGIKVAEHSGGETVLDPLTASREEDSVDSSRIDRFLMQAMPQVTKERTRHEVCFYTMSPDENFIVDQHPQFSNVSFAAGLSGHGFKFASALGKVLVDLAIDGGSELPIEFLSWKRFRIEA